MIKLQPDQYPAVAPLVNSVPYNHLFARVVMENSVHGHVFADDATTPSVCFIIHKYGMAMLIGDDKNALVTDRLGDFLHAAVQSEFPAKWLLIYPQTWEHTLAGFVDNRHFLQTQRINYTFHPELFSFHHIDLPDGFTLRKIDAELYHRIQGSVVPQHFWNCAEDFLAHGIGFSLLDGDQIVSTTFTSFVGDGKLELGVETAAAFRQKGYSVYAASALVAYCLEHGYEPVWACRLENVGSSRLAERLGFVPSSYHPYYCLPSRMR